MNIEDAKKIVSGRVAYRLADLRDTLLLGSTEKTIWVAGGALLEGKTDNDVDLFSPDKWDDTIKNLYMYPSIKVLSQSRNATTIRSGNTT